MLLEDVFQVALYAIRTVPEGSGVMFRYNNNLFESHQVVLVHIYPVSVSGLGGPRVHG